MTQTDVGLKGMVHIPGGEFRMGSAAFYPEEAPVHRVSVDDLLRGRAPGDGRRFRRFVKDTSHVTEAEKR